MNSIHSFPWDKGQFVKVNSEFYDRNATELRFLNVVKDAVYSICMVKPNDGNFEYAITVNNKQITFAGENLVLLPVAEQPKSKTLPETPFWVRRKFIFGRTIIGEIRGIRYSLNAKTGQVYKANVDEWVLTTQPELDDKPYIHKTLVQEYNNEAAVEKKFAERLKRKEYARAMSCAAKTGQSAINFMGKTTRN